jgi:predicted AAA+ superfamily ATPase
MLQRLKETDEGLYFSADNPMIKTVGLYQLVHYLYIEKDLRMLYIDEIHKSQDWVEHIKSMYDSLPELKVVFSGSSSLDLFKGVLDLMRRVEFYNIFPMNYREYLKFFHTIDIPAFTLEEVLQNHEQISEDYATKHKQTFFEDFIQKGQYPYIKKYEGLDYVSKFQNLMEKVILEDLPVFVNLQTDSLDKLKRLVYFIANTPPSELSFTSLAKKIGLHKSIVENVLTLLSKI